MKRIHTHLSILVTLTLLSPVVPPSLLSQPFSIHHVDRPFGGQPSHFVAAPDSTLYCQVYDVGLYTSDDDGRTWRIEYSGRGTGLWTPHTAFFNTFAQRNTLVVSAYGNTWLMPADGHRYEFYGSLDARYAYDATSFGETIVIATNNGVGISRDRGYTWEKTGEEGAYSQEVEYVDGYLYSVRTDNADGTDNQIRIARSLDSGFTWQVLELPPEFRMPTTAPDPHTGDFLLYFDNLGLYRWGREDDSLSAIDTGRRGDADVTASPGGEVFLMTSDSMYIYSAEGDLLGLIVLSGPLRNAEELASTPEGTLLLGSHGNGIFRSTDTGRTWAQVGVPSGSRFYSAAMLSDGTTLASTAGADLYRIGNPEGPNDWELVNSDGRAFRWVTTGDTGDWFAYANDTLFRSTDRGDNWSGWRVDSVDALERSPDGSFIALISGDVRRSTDHGATWEEVHRVSWLDGMIEAGPDGDLWIGVANTLLRSRDSGQTWRSWDIPSLGFSQSSPTAIGFTPAGTVLVQLVGFQHQMMRTTDRGETWERVENRPCDGNISRIYGFQETFTLAFGWCGLHYSTDDGISWSEVPGFPENLSTIIPLQTSHGLLIFTEEGLYIIRQSSSTPPTLTSQPLNLN